MHRHAFAGQQQKRADCTALDGDLLPSLIKKTITLRQLQCRPWFQWPWIAWYASQPMLEARAAVSRARRPRCALPIVRNYGASSSELSFCRCHSNPEPLWVRGRVGVYSASFEGPLPIYLCYRHPLCATDQAAYVSSGSHRNGARNRKSPLAARCLDMQLRGSDK